MNDIIVAGGGLAGAATATCLAQAGRSVTLIEREAAPAHKICGEFLSTEAQTYLTQLGLDISSLGGHRVTQVRLVHGKSSITSKLPFEGLGLTRRTLDEALLDHAATAGVTVHRGHAIRNIAFDNSASGVSVQVDQLGALHPQILMLATGKHEARGAARIAAPGDMVGFKTYFRLQPGQRDALCGHVELNVFPGGYAGLQMVEQNQANFCVLVKSSLLHRVGGKWAGLLDYLQHTNPHLAARLAGAEDLLGAPLAIARVPYGFVHKPRADDATWMFRLGDQAAVIQSFTGDGMAIALHSAALAAQFVLRGDTAAAYHRRLRADVIGQIRRAAILHRLVSAPVLGASLFTAARLYPKILAISASITRVPAHARLSY